MLVDNQQPNTHVLRQRKENMSPLGKGGMQTPRRAHSQDLSGNERKRESDS